MSSQSQKAHRPAFGKRRLPAAPEDAARSRDLGIIERNDKIEAPTLHAVFCVTSPSSSTIASRIRNFCGLPVTVIGNSLRKRVWRGIL